MKSTKEVEEVNQRSGGSPPMKWRELAHLQGNEAHHEVVRESLRSTEESSPKEWRKFTKRVDNEAHHQVEREGVEEFH